MTRIAAQYLDDNITDEMLEVAAEDGRLSIEADGGEYAPSPDSLTYIVLRNDDDDDELILHPMPTYFWSDWCQLDEQDRLEWYREGIESGLEKSDLTDDELIDWLDLIF